MNAKIDNFSEMESVLSVKSDMNDGIVTLFGRFTLSNQLGLLACSRQPDLSIGIQMIGYANGVMYSYRTHISNGIQNRNRCMPDRMYGGMRGR